MWRARSVPMTRFLRFNVVSAVGLAVQLAIVVVLVRVSGVHYLVASALAIEVSVLHNFAWHERWTWKGRGLRPDRGSALGRCLAFHAANGLVSLVGALVLLPGLVGWLGLHYAAANLVACLATGLLNYLLSDLLVFVREA